MKRCFILLGVIVALLLIAVAASAQDVQKVIGTVTVTSDGSVNIRSGGNTDARVVGNARPGDVFTCTGKTESGWYEIVLDSNIVGYVSPKMVDFKELLEARIDIEEETARIQGGDTLATDSGAMKVTDNGEAEIQTIPEKSSIASEILAAGSLQAVLHDAGGAFRSWTPESFPEIWITPHSGSGTSFLHFSSPQGASLTGYSNYGGGTSVKMTNFDTQLSYGYYTRDYKSSIQKFLEEAAEKGYDVLADGTDGFVARVCTGYQNTFWAEAMISISDYFSNSYTLNMSITDRNNHPVRSREELGKMVCDEAVRVMSSMQFVKKLGRFWSKGVFSSVELVDCRFPLRFFATVDTKDMTITVLENTLSCEMRSQILIDGRMRKIGIKFTGGGPEGAKGEDATLVNGTPYLLKIDKDKCVAFFSLEHITLMVL
ncbi:MAG: SH3 domain-containing protein [Firmicutes bacterium]|nr:SH3 domain-containing protein [Bacillota bacterium]